MRYCHENVGKPDPEYGGVLTDISTLPVGTTFYVKNGAWYGKIVDLDGTKGVQTSSKPFVNGKMPPHRKPVPLFPDGDENNILALSDVHDPDADGTAKTRSVAVVPTRNHRKE